MKTTRELQARIFDKINPAVRFSVTRYVFAIGVFVAIFAFGLISVLNLGVDQFPSINFPYVVVTTAYPGASPSVIDQQVTQVIENAVSTLSGITDINSFSSTGASQVIMAFEQTTDQASDANQVASLVSAASRSLPQGVDSPIVQTFNPSSIPVVQFGISGAGAGLGDVSTYVTNELTPLLERVSGVANIQVDGGPSRQFQVLLNPDRLQSFDLTPQQVVGAIVGSAINQPIGTINSHNNALTFATENIPADTQKVAGTLVDAVRGIRVSDIAAVRDLPISTNYARVNGRPVVLVSIQKTTSSNAVAVVRNVKSLLHDTKLPAGYEISYSNDTTAPIQASLNSTYREILITVIVVLLVVLLFLGRINTALSVILAMPIALSAAPVLFNLAGFTLNLVSMLAMIVAIGIVVDDSIVVAENVERYRVMGFSQKESVLKGASEIFSAVVAATLSLLSVLIPVSFIGGIIGDFLRQFALGLAAAVGFSLLEAVLFLTVRLAYTRTNGEEEDRLEQGEGDRRGEAEGELPEELADDAADEAHRDEDREQGQGRRDDGAEDLAGPLEHGLLLAEAHGAVALDVLRDDDRIVHDDADRDDHREHGHEVQGEAREVVEHRRGGERDGNGEDDGEGRVELAEEEEDDQGDDDRR